MELQARFNGLTGTVFDLLAEATAELSQELYLSGHNLVNLKSDEPATLAVGIEGKANSGKSRFSNPFLRLGVDSYACTQGQTMERPISITSTKSVEIPVWRSCWCDQHRQENRVRDCLLTDPFSMNNSSDNDLYAEVKFFTPHMKQRDYSGIEVLEHSGAVPKDLISLKIQLAIATEATRDATITILNYNDSVSDLWACFREGFWEKCRAEKSHLKANLGGL